MDIEKTAEEIMKKFQHFLDGTRVQMLINRGVGNTNKGSKRWVSKLVSTNLTEYYQNLCKLLAMQKHWGDPDVRLYACVNARNAPRALNNFQHELLDVRDSVAINYYVARMNDKWISCLMKPECRNESLFLLDVDSKGDEIPNSLQERLGQKIGFTYVTPNGRHMICDGFNPILIDGIPNVEIKRDALLLLHALEK